jgi:hypothetical protein
LIFIRVPRTSKTVIMAAPEVLMVRYPTSASCLLAFIHVSAFGHMQTVSCKICMYCHQLPTLGNLYKHGTKDMELIRCSGRYWRVHDRIRWRWRVKVRQEGRRSWSDAVRPPKTRKSRQAVHGWYIGRQIPRDPYVKSPVPRPFYHMQDADLW